MSNSSKLDYLKRTYEYYFLEDADLRVEKWPLMDSPGTTIAIVVVYMYFVKSLGPRLMKDRKPFELRNVLIIYNAIMAFVNLWLFTECIRAGWFWDFSFRCQPMDRSYDPRIIRMVRGSWWFLITKFMDLLDTVFFVLRMRSAQMSFLHIFHHAIMPIMIWYGIKFSPGGHASFAALVNTFIHFVMYTYYLMAALGPQYRKYLWWKKYITIMQIMQFLVGMVHSGQLFFIECDFPRFYRWVCLVLGPTFLALFYDFYVKSYCKLSKDKKETASSPLTICMRNEMDPELVRRRAMSATRSSEKDT